MYLFCAVYLNNTTIGTSTDLEGYFSLAVDGSYDELIVSFVGYEVITHIINMDELDKRYTFLLKPTQHLLTEAVIKDKRKASWYRNLEFFTSNFLGKSKATNKTKIVNPEVLYFEKTDSIFQAYAREPIVIENSYTGYRIHYNLVTFDLDVKKSSLVNLGYPLFELLEGSLSAQRRWQRNRAKIYSGSLEHFLHAMCSTTIANQYEVNRTWLTNRFVISALYQLGLVPVAGERKVDPDIIRMASEVFKSKRLLKRKYVVDNQSINPMGHLEKTDDGFRLDFRDIWQVKYNVKSGDKSFMYLSDGAALLDQNCRLIDPLDIWVEHEWSKSQVANLLPFDEMDKRFQMRTLLNTKSN